MQQRADHGQQRHHDEDRQDRSRQRPGEEAGRIATEDQHRTACTRFDQRAEYERQHHWAGVEPSLLHQVTDNAEADHQEDVEDRVVDGVDAEDRDQRGDRGQDRGPHPQDPDEQADQRDGQNQQQYVADVHRVDDAPEQIRVLVDQLRPWRDAEDQQRTEQHRHRRVGGNADGQPMWQPSLTN